MHNDAGGISAVYLRRRYVEKLLLHHRMGRCGRHLLVNLRFRRFPESFRFEKSTGRKGYQPVRQRRITNPYKQKNPASKAGFFLSSEYNFASAEAENHPGIPQEAAKTQKQDDSPDSVRLRMLISHTLFSGAVPPD